DFAIHDFAILMWEPNPNRKWQNHGWQNHDEFCKDNGYDTSVTETIRTTCTMDCPDSCALDVIVTDGKIARIQAAPAEKSAHPNTQGFICDKVGKFDRRVYHDSRILYPQRRVGQKGEARFERISWDEAISTIVERFRAIIARWGAEAILPYHYDGSNGLLSHD